QQNATEKVEILRSQITAAILQEKICEPDDRLQWGSQFMTHASQCRTLGKACLFCNVFCPLPFFSLVSFCNVANYGSDHHLFAIPPRRQRQFHWNKRSVLSRTIQFDTVPDHFTTTGHAESVQAFS